MGLSVRNNARRTGSYKQRAEGGPYNDQLGTEGARSGFTEDEEKRKAR